MDLLKKLDELDKRFAEINEMVQDPDLVKDQKKYKDVMREHGHLTDVLEVGNEYRKCLSGTIPDYSSPQTSTILPRLPTRCASSVFT